MPEGDTVWLTAHRLDRALSGRPITVCDFRVPALATVSLQGRTVTEVIPRGKHVLFSVEQGRGETIYALDLATKKVTFVAWNYGYEPVLVRRGPYEGALFVADSPQVGVATRCRFIDGTISQARERGWVATVLGRRRYRRLTRAIRPPAARSTSTRS